jgi:hypothetical protein
MLLNTGYCFLEIVGKISNILTPKYEAINGFIPNFIRTKLNVNY